MEIKISSWNFFLLKVKHLTIAIDDIINSVKKFNIADEIIFVI